MKLTQEDIIYRVFYWKKKLKIPFFYLTFDNQMGWMGYVDSIGKKNRPVLYLNSKQLIQSPEDLLFMLFHEFGHIKHKDYLLKQTKINKIKMEYRAEKYALHMIKKYCSINIYHRQIRAWKFTLADKKWREEFPIHYTAFKKIYEKQ